MGTFNSELTLIVLGEGKIHHATSKVLASFGALKSARAAYTFGRTKIDQISTWGSGQFQIFILTLILSIWSADFF